MKRKTSSPVFERSLVLDGVAALLHVWSVLAAFFNRTAAGPNPGAGPLWRESYGALVMSVPPAKQPAETLPAMKTWFMLYLHAHGDVLRASFSSFVGEVRS